MLSFQTTLALLSIFLSFPALTQAHMSLKSPPSLGYLGNPYATNVDYSLNSPISGAQYPCKGYHLEPSRGANQSVTSWAAGSPQSFELEGSAIHGGGSCQASLSYDNGATFKVIASYIGGCPATGNAPFVFKVPAEAQSGQVLFAWTWFNKTGNREMYMGCAVVDITGGGQEGLGRYPDIFTANIGGSCSVPEGVTVEFPHPGTNVVRNGEASGPPTCV